MESIKKGSGKYRKILARGEKNPDINNPTAWKKKTKGRHNHILLSKEDENQPPNKGNPLRRK